MKGVQLIPLQYDYPGWWAKMEQFTCSTLLDYDIVLSLDLDLFIMQSLDPVIGWGTAHHICFAPQTEMNISSVKEGKRRVQAYRTATMTYKPMDMLWYGKLFQKSASNFMKRYHGDQDWWGDTAHNACTFPVSWFCKTKHLVKGNKKPGSEVRVVFGNHVKNDEAIKKWQWAKEVWQ